MDNERKGASPPMPMGKSPTLVPQKKGVSPPLQPNAPSWNGSYQGRQGSGDTTSPNGMGGGNGAPPPPFSLSDDKGSFTVQAGTPVTRPGTDPTKYKTAMCRNWEQYGSCTFRGCSFAHGIEELRPAKTPNMGPSTPPTVPNCYNSGNPRVEQLLEMIAQEIRKEHEAMAMHQETGRTLESLFKREQAQRQEDQRRIELLQQHVQRLEKQLEAKDAEIVRLRGGEPANNSTGSGATTGSSAYGVSPVGLSTGSLSLGEAQGSISSVDGGHNATSPTAAHNDDHLRTILQSLNLAPQA